MATTFEYNRENQLTQIHRPDGQSLVLGYLAGSGRLLSLAQPSGIESKDLASGEASCCLGRPSLWHR